MSEWLTTGEMIDRLKVGEVAEIVSGSKYLAVTKSEDESIRITNNHSKGEWLPLSHLVVGYKWRILPKYVTFEEAMQALKNGKKVKVDNCTRAFDKNEDMEDSVGAYANWGDLLEGKWQIIE